MIRTAGLLVVVLSLVLAGCTASPIGGTDTPASDADGGQGATLNFYLSDEENAIGEFRHLNVTVTSVGFQRGGESGDWIERDVDNRTVDLTELQGARATRLASFDVPNGTYTKVFIHVSAVNGTLNGSGESVTVKLPSEKLQLTTSFTLNNSSEVDFVYDISVHKAGQSGKYILRPVVSESGTDVPIEPVDDRGEAKDDRDGDREGDGDDLNLTFVGNVTPGENATLLVTRNGSAVGNATVTVNGEVVGTTDADGRLIIAIPADAETVTVLVTHDDEEEEREIEFDEEEADDEEETSTATPTETATADG